MMGQIADVKRQKVYLSKLKIWDGSISSTLHISNRTGSEKTLSTFGASMALKNERLMPTFSARAS